MAAKRCQKASCLGEELCEEWHCCEVDHSTKKAKSQSQLVLIDRIFLWRNPDLRNPRGGRHELYSRIENSNNLHFVLTTVVTCCILY